MERLKHKRILLILDDVEKLAHVENLLRKCDWCAFGIRIIITRDKQLLATLQGGGRVSYYNYKVKELNEQEAHELFCQHAFKRNKPKEGNSELVDQFICYSKGLPLALKIISFDLYERNIYCWESTLDRYKRIPCTNIQEKLKISYDGLDPSQQNIFLDIACFLKGFRKFVVIDILQSCNFYNPFYDIEKLIDKNQKFPRNIEGYCVMRMILKYYLEIRYKTF